MNTLIKLFLIWFTASIGYYFIIPIFGLGISYNIDPAAISIYYAVCSTLVVAYFHKEYFHKLKNIWLLLFLSIFLSGFISVFLYSFSTLAQLQTLIKTEYLSSYVEILMANKWFFFPKAFEVLFQDILITVLILELNRKYNSVKQVSFVYFAVFVGAHILQLIFTNTQTEYSLLLILGAMFSSLIFPRFIINQQEGIIYVFTIHFLFYVFLSMYLHVNPPLGYFFVMV